MASKLDKARRAASAARKRAEESQTQVAIANAVGSFGAGALKGSGVLPVTIGGVDSAAVVGTALAVVSFGGFVPKAYRPVTLGLGSGMVAPLLYQTGVQAGEGAL
mgnify:CR=1 FL=1